MSLTIIQAGILDTIQDSGRYGYQHLGINPGGAIDRYSAQLSNAILGKDLSAPVIELHYPSASIQFQKKTIISITGADFTPLIEEKEVPLNRPIIVDDNCTLKFKKLKTGVRCYLSVLHQMDLEKWLNSYSTNIKANAGGWKGRTLKKNDIIQYQNSFDLAYKLPDKFSMLSWGAVDWEEMKPGEILCIKGKEWELLTNDSKTIFAGTYFKISGMADRMGYRLTGVPLELKNKSELISTAVSFGTVQLPPDGQPIILMADHQTTGGYAKIAHVISAHLPAIAQMKTGDLLKFKLTDIKIAEEKLGIKNKHLQQVQFASKMNLEKLLLHYVTN